MIHVLDRFVIHFFSACGAVLACLFVLLMVIRKCKNKLLPTSKEQALLVAAIVVFAFSTVREAWDVAAGQTLTKAGFDYVSWLTGCGVAVWALIRWDRMP